VLVLFPLSLVLLVRRAAAQTLRGKAAGEGLPLARRSFARERLAEPLRRHALEPAFIASGTAARRAVVTPCLRPAWAGSWLVVRGRWCIVGALAVCVQFTPSAGAGPQWLSPALVWTFAGDEELAGIAGNGDAVVALTVRPHANSCEGTSRAPGLCTLTVSARSRARSGWSAPVDVATFRSLGPSFVEVAVNRDGDAAAVWEVRTYPHGTLMQASYRRGFDGVWQSPTSISGHDAEVADDPAVTVTATGEAIVAWTEKVWLSERYVVKTAAHSSDAASWYGTEPISAPDEYAPWADVQIAANQRGEAVAAWSGDRVIRVAIRSARGKWGPPIDLLRNPNALVSPHVAVGEDGSAYALWWLPSARNDALGTIEFSFCPAGGQWRAVEKLTPDDASGSWFALDRAGNALASFSRHSALFVRSWDRERQSWRAPVRLAGNDADSVQLVFDDRGNAIATWNTRSDRLTHASLRPAATGAWLPATTIARVEPGATSPTLIGGPPGEALLLWARSNKQLIEAKLGGSGPLLTELNVPRRSAARLVTTFSVRAVPWSASLLGAPVWTFGDRKSARGTRVRHLYRRAGVYAVFVSARDAAGGRSTATSTIRIRRPSASRP
jgi:PKD domain-containing protein